MPPMGYRMAKKHLPVFSIAAERAELVSVGNGKKPMPTNLDIRSNSAQTRTGGRVTIIIRLLNGRKRETLIGEKKKLPESYMSCETIIRDCYKGMELLCKRHAQETEKSMEKGKAKH